MINNLQLIRNVGRFDSVVTAARIPFSRLTLVYAENGRGKTTLAAIFRSLATGDPIPIVERKRLSAQHPPHIVIGCAGGPATAIFQNGVWGRTLPNIVVFDDVFVDQNVYSGLLVETEHRQNLHELIIGGQGVALNQQLQNQIAQVEAHNTTIRQRGAAIPIADLGGLTLDQFCALPVNPNVEVEIQEAERNLAAAREQEPVRNTPAFEMIHFPTFDLPAIEAVLRAELIELDAAAAARVQEHLATSGGGAETWIGEGMRRQAERPPQVSGECVFCAQDISGSLVMGHYRAFFSEAYRTLQRNIVGSMTVLNQTNADSAAINLERTMRVLSDRRQFWSQFTELVEFRLDTATIVRDWQSARTHLIALLAQKQASPLDAVSIPDAVLAAVQLHDRNLAIISTLNQKLVQANAAIAAVKQRAATTNPDQIKAALSRLITARSRHNATNSALCDSYLAEKEAKVAVERLRDQAKVALEQYRITVFPNYQVAINRYLAQFNAGFHLDSVTVANTRGGPACTYNVMINNTAVAVAGGGGQSGEASFKNTLSAGDRNALALAFFFSAIELDPNQAAKTVVIDDPVSSLDEHRSLTTVQEIRRLSARVAQVIVLSHSKSFLCRIWSGADHTARAALIVVRNGDGSLIQAWNVDNDSITEHDRRDSALRAYVLNSQADEREIARALRPHLEAFFRVACPEHFPPSTLLGPFRGLCDQRVNTPQQILNARDINELRDIVEYANRFHHDTNPAWETEVVNAVELTGFVSRVLAFVKRL